MSISRTGNTNLQRIKSGNSGAVLGLGLLWNLVIRASMSCVLIKDLGYTVYIFVKTQGVYALN